MMPLLNRFKIQRCVSCYTRFNTYTTARGKRVMPRKEQSEKKQAKKFVDFRVVKVTGGKGGDGCMSFLSLPFNEWAGPDGGNGGNGGHVVFKANTNVKSLEKLPKIIKAEDGVKGGHKNCDGKNAAHLYLEVPVGTVVKSMEQEVVGELPKPDAIFIAARGGSGGHGNRHFLSNENRAPTIYEEGAPGEELQLSVELRVMAHAGLVGFPNAGKSTLLRAISRARPKVASYPFTTLNPHVGMVEYDDLTQVAVADIPGLIQGAHLNYGLGFSFLRHIERCLCLLYVLDLSHDAPWEQLEALKYELEQYRPGLSERPHAIVANKLDLPEAKENLLKLKEKTTMQVFGISAEHKLNIRGLLSHLRELYDANVDKT